MKAVINNETNSAKKEEIKYENISKLSEESVNKFYKYYKFKVNRLEFLSSILCSVVLILLAVYYLMRWDRYFLGLIANILINVPMILLAIYFVINAFQVQKYDKKKMNKIYGEDITKLSDEYIFYEDKIVITNKYGETDRPYNYLWGIYESKDYYYIFSKKDVANIMRKDSFIKGEEKDFHNFIKKKVKRFHKR